MEDFEEMALDRAAGKPCCLFHHIVIPSSFGLIDQKLKALWMT
jgi:hypothetical protein